jgi:DNA-binding LytR/AlgR family response regulator
MYTVPVFAYQYITKKSKPTAKVFISEIAIDVNHFLENILVAEGTRKFNVVVSEVLFFTASPPYISIHLDDKKYLHNGTLKSISQKLNPEHFVRVHKSTIVNIKMVASYSSRLNGDYDLKMINDVTLRVSRNFAADFKKLYAKSHHLTTL